jgi:hypothetical protein
MVESIGRLCRRIVKRPLVPLMVVVVGAHVPGDPARRGTGYGGVLPVPGPSVPPPTTTTHVDPMLDAQHHDVRIARGRVLYAPGHEPSRATTSPSKTRGRKGPCPEERVVQGRSTASPNS